MQYAVRDGNSWRLVGWTSYALRQISKGEQKGKAKESRNGYEQ
jgi:hypothetical protein